VELARRARPGNGSKAEWQGKAAGLALDGLL
jgi:hypothetical protein